MVTIARNPLGFHLLNARPKGSNLTGEYYRNNIIAGLLQLRPALEDRRLCLHADNARVHTARKCQACCRENRLRILTHPPYSRDLAESDIFLFGHVKHCLAAAAFASRSELFEAIQSVVTSGFRPLAGKAGLGRSDSR
jgi:histone-lysine N-methyltransferase SETMAR